MEKHKRIEWVDIAKGIAIILVVIGHVGSSYGSAGLYKDSFLLNFTNRFVYSFHMAAFMFISGFLFKNKGNKKQQIKAILISLSIRIDNKVLSFIGRRTLPIYVLHGIFIAATRIALGKMGLNDIYGIGPFIICTVAGVVVPLSIYEICVKWNLDFFFTPKKFIRK